MKQKNKKKILGKKYILNGYLIFIILISVTVGYIEIQKQENCNIDINYSLDEVNSSLKYNYILFLDKNGKSHGKLVETNGWLLLEAVLDRALGNQINRELKKTAESFGQDYLVGWWPGVYMQNGKNYFINGKPVTLYYDSDDTAWGHRLNNKKISYDTTKVYLSNDTLKEPFFDMCDNINCDNGFIVRVWSGEDWHDDVDLIIVSNFITALDLTSEFNKNIFDQNKKLINYVIENHDIDNFFAYYEPKVTGYFLLLFYDDLGPQFLTKKSREILLQKISNNSNDFAKESLVARWGGGEDWFYGCNIVTVNERIPKLMQKYAKERYNIS